MPKDGRVLLTMILAVKVEDQKRDSTSAFICATLI